MIKNLSDFTSKNREPLTGIYIAPDRIAATDSFKLIEQKRETGAKEPYIALLPKGVKTFETAMLQGNNTTVLDDQHIAKVIDGDFPKYESIWPTDKPIATIKLSAKHLEQVAKAFVGLDPFDGVTIEIRGDKYKPLVFIEEKSGTRAMLMPMTGN